MAQIIKLTEEQLNNVVKNISEDKMKKMKNPCWKGYKAYGTKMKNGKKYLTAFQLTNIRLLN